MANELIEEKTKKTPKQKVWFGVRIALNVVFYAIILLVLLFSISNIRAKNENDKIPNVFGLGYLNVLSDSMDGDFKDSFKAGDMIIVKTASKKNIASLEVGDIVTFLDYNLASNKGASTALNTHRIVYIDKNTNIFYTVGDKAMKLSNGFDITTLNDENCLTMLQQTFGLNGFQAFGSSEIRGIYSSKWTGFGSVIQTINNHFVAIIIVPIAILLVLELGYLIYNIMKVREEKLKKDLKPEADLVMTDDDKEKLKDELRAQLLAEMGVSAPVAETLEDSSKETQSEEVNETELLEETLDETKKEYQSSDESTETVNDESVALDEPATEKIVETQAEEVVNEPVADVLPTEPVGEAKEEVTESKEETLDAPKPKKTTTKKTTTTKKAPTTAATKKTTTAKKTTTKKSETTAETKETEVAETPVKKATTKKTATAASTKKADSSAKKTTTTKKASTNTAAKKTTTKKTTAKKSDSNE